MSSIVINPKNEQELQLINELLMKMGVDAKVLLDEDSEDLGLALMMKDLDLTETAPESEIMAKFSR